MSDVFDEVAELLFGGGADELVSKMNPVQSDLATHERKKRELTAGLSTVGGAAGALGLAVGAKEVATHGWKGTPKLTRALIPAEIAGLGGEVMAAHILHGDAKKKSPMLRPVKRTKIKKDIKEILNNSKSVPTKRSVTLAAVTSPQARKKGMEYRKKTGGVLRRLPDKVVTTNKVEKADDELVDVTWSGAISKASLDKQQIFGWASVVEVNGEPVVDLQGDHISPEEMEKAAYTYVQKSRKGGDMHLQDNWQPIQKSEMIESFIVTDEKREAMGLPDSVPTGWWVGFQVQDPDVWAKVKSGERTGFSIHGRGKRSAL